jgi:hypothetical protein
VLSVAALVSTTMSGSTSEMRAGGLKGSARKLQSKFKIVNGQVVPGDTSGVIGIASAVPVPFPSVPAKKVFATSGIFFIKPEDATKNALSEVVLTTKPGDDAAAAQKVATDALKVITTKFFGFTTSP